MRDAAAGRLIVIREEGDTLDLRGGVKGETVLRHVGEVDGGGVVGGLEGAGGVEGAGGAGAVGKVSASEHVCEP